METLALNNSTKQFNTVENNLVFSNIQETIMKKLSNTSPFLLLLLPLFIMIILTFTVNSNQQDTGDVVVKPAKTAASIVKQANVIFK